MKSCLLLYRILLFQYSIFSVVTGQLSYPCDYLDSTCDEEHSMIDDTGRTMNGRRCFCDDKCAKLGDCCEVSLPTETLVKCIGIPFYEHQYIGIYATSFCSNGISCPVQQADPLTLLPAFRKHSHIVYRNVFCALCNGENFGNLLLGEIKFDCQNGTLVDDDTAKNPLPFFMSNDFDGVIPRFCRLLYKLPAEAKSTKCIPTVDTCPSGSDSKASQACSSYMRTVFGEDTLYKNPDCAVCNGVDVDTLSGTSCLTPLFKDLPPDESADNHSNIISPKGTFTADWKTGFSMTILLDLNLEGGNVIGAQRKCKEGYIYDPWKTECRAVFCPDERKFSDGTCQLIVSKVLRNDSSNPNSTVKLRVDLPNCPRIEFQKTDYRVIGEMIYVNSSGRMYNISDVVFTDSVAAVCMTDEYGEFVPSFSDSEIFMSIACFTLSVICLIMHFAIYISAGKYLLVPDLNMLSISLAIFLVHVFFLLAPLAQHYLSGNLCAITGVLLHFFALSSFTWSFIIAYDITKTVASLEHPSYNSHAYSNFTRYSLFAWLLPALPVVTAVTIDLVYPESEFSPIYGKNICWIGRRKSLWVFFGIPVAAIIAGNLIFYVITAAALWRSHKTRSSLKNVTANKSSQDDIRFGLYLKLAMIMGIAWITGFIAIAAPPLRYVSIATNGLQGVYIFAAFSCKRSVFKAAKKRRRGLGRVLDRLASLGSKQSGSCNTSVTSANSQTPVVKTLSSSSGGTSVMVSKNIYT